MILNALMYDILYLATLQLVLLWLVKLMFCVFYLFIYSLNKIVENLRIFDMVDELKAGGLLIVTLAESP